jgi:DnaJ domain
MLVSRLMARAAGRPAPEDATFRLQYVNCGKSKCRTCHGQAYAHGPYWYGYVHRRGGPGMRSYYIGKKRPAAVAPEKEHVYRARAAQERAEKEREEAAARRRDSAHQQQGGGGPRAAHSTGRRTNSGSGGGASSSWPPPSSPGRRASAADWALLGLAVSASAAAVKNAYRRLALRLHPDRDGGSTEAMQRLNAAYDRVRRAIPR